MVRRCIAFHRRELFCPTQVSPCPAHPRELEVQEWWWRVAYWFHLRFGQTRKYPVGSQRTVRSSSCQPYWKGLLPELRRRLFQLQVWKSPQRELHPWVRQLRVPIRRPEAFPPVPVRDR